MEKIYNTDRNKSNICMEAAINLRVNENHMVTFMCTPFDIETLAIGYLVSRGIVKEMEDIKSIKSSVLCGVDILLRDGVVLEDSTAPKLILSGCGTGMGFDLEILKKSKLNSELKISLKDIREKFVQMLEKALMYKTMGGMHCAALYEEGRDEIIIREDIGRHNAVDKVIGEGMKKGFNFSKCVLLVTGRISSDMVFKGAGAGISVIASRSITSDLALSLAEELGMLLIGRASYPEPIIYLGSEKIRE